MSIDISLFIEVDSGKKFSKLMWKPFTKDDNINLLSDGEFFIEQDYGFFAAISDVLVDTYAKKPLIKSKGLPKVISGDLFKNLFLLVLNEDEEPWNGIECISAQKAKKYVDKGMSYYKGSKEYIDGKLQLSHKRNIFNHEYYSCSWLYLEELLKSLKHHDIDIEELGPTVQVIINIMNDWESKFGKDSIRCIFCFTG